MKRSGYADLPLHYGRVPKWLYERMRSMGGAIIEAIVQEYGPSEVLRRLSDPFWFQSLGCVLGMDWHSSGVTTSVMGALKHAVNPVADSLGIYICGGRGSHSRATPDEIRAIADRTGLAGDSLVRCSRLSAKIDNTALQDGFQIYLHSFILTREGEWAVVQQGMNETDKTARRYHWHSPRVASFVEQPHASICGPHQGMIINLTDNNAAPTRDGILTISHEHPDAMLREIRALRLPAHHHVSHRNCDLKRLGSVLTCAYEACHNDFASLLLTKGLGPRTLRSLTLVSEVIHGTPSRFNDPARFSFAHGGKDAHPYPVQTSVYDTSLSMLRKAIDRAKIGYTDKRDALKKLHTAQQKLDSTFVPDPQNAADRYNTFIRNEKNVSYRYGGRSVFGKSKPPARARFGSNCPARAPDVYPPGSHAPVAYQTELFLNNDSNRAPTDSQL